MRVNVQKKIKNIFFKFFDIGRDTLINKLLNYYHINNGILIYSIISANPIDMVIGLLASKLGLSKVVIMLIVAFLL
jgi:hypothetical protein